MEHFGFQCGFCTPGMAVTASTLTEDDLPDLDRRLKGNLCRCTGYRPIREAVTDAVLGPVRETGAVVRVEEEGVGRSARPAPARRIVQGLEPYTFDVDASDALILRVVSSPHAHARIRAIDTTAARAVPGVVAILTHEDAPALRYSSGRHEHREDDPDDMRVLDDVVRHIGQRVVAVVAETAAAAEEACRLVAIDYAVLPSVTDPEAARMPGAPLLHPDRTPADRVAEAHRNVVATIHEGHGGDIDAALAASAVTVSGTWRTSRVAHAQLETHGAIGWIEDGRYVIRSSTQVPFLTRDELCRVFGLDRDRLRVFAARLGGAFGGKQEIFAEDLVLLAVRATGRKVAYEFSRTDEFWRAAVRHPMRVSVTLGSDAEGRLTAMKLDVLSDTGAYGNHAIGVMFHAMAESTTLYRTPVRRLDAEVVYTNNVPSGAFRGYGLGQVQLGVESAMDMLAERLGMDPFDLRRLNAVREGDRLHLDDDKYEADLVWGSYGLDQCLDLAQDALRRGNGVVAPLGDNWRVGEGMAAAMIATMAPAGTSPTRRRPCAPTARSCSRPARRSSATARRPCTGRSRHPFWEPASIASSCARATRMPCSTTRVPMRRRVRRSRARRCMPRASCCATASSPSPPRSREPMPRRARSPPTGCARRQAWSTSHASSRRLRPHTARARPHGGRDGEFGDLRSLAFNVHAVRVAVDVETGIVRVLQSVQAADAGFVMNPAQCRGQVEGGAAQGLGSALYEEVYTDEEGAVVNPVFRMYRVPQIGDVPETEVYFAETDDAVGPFGAKSMSESPYNPVAPALGNAIARALGQRPFHQPFSRDRVWRLAEPLRHPHD